MNRAEEKVFIKDIRAGQDIVSEFLLDELRLGQTKGGKPFVGLRLQDKTGRMEGRVWDRAQEFYDNFKNGDAALVRGVADSYQNKVQLKVIEARILAEDQVDPSRFLPASEHNIEEMFDELLNLAGTMANRHLRTLIRNILGDENLAAAFKKAPAAKRFHHAYLGGLLEHTLSVARLAAAVCPLYPVLDRDLVITGAILHDLGKIREFDLGLTGDYTDEGRFLGHLVIGVQMLEEKISLLPDFPAETALLLKHLIVSHHGEYEMGSPKRPKILEGLILHHLDDIDAKMNGIGGYIERHADEDTGWTDFNRLMGRFFYKHVSEAEAGPVEQSAAEMETMAPEISDPEMVESEIPEPVAELEPSEPNIGNDFVEDEPPERPAPEPDDSHCINEMDLNGADTIIETGEDVEEKDQIQDPDQLSLLGD